MMHTETRQTICPPFFIQAWEETTTFVKKVDTRFKIRCYGTLPPTIAHIAIKITRAVPLALLLIFGGSVVRISFFVGIAILKNFQTKFYENFVQGERRIVLLDSLAIYTAITSLTMLTLFLNTGLPLALALSIIKAALCAAALYKSIKLEKELMQPGLRG